MCPNRKQQAGAQTTQFLGAMDSLENLDNLIIFATSDAVEEIDPAIRRPRRLDQEVRSTLWIISVLYLSFQSNDCASY